MMIQPISSAAQQPAAVEGVRAASGIQTPETKGQDHFPKPVMDEYIPEEKQEPSGRYWIGRDEDGQPKVYFDDPERADAPERQDEIPDADKAGEDKRASGKKAESCTGNTDKVDREIEKLKKQREELKRQLQSGTDESKIKGLEQKLAQVERELARKDNDTYRRQHTVFSFREE